MTPSREDLVPQIPRRKSLPCYPSHHSERGIVSRTRHTRGTLFCYFSLSRNPPGRQSSQRSSSHSQHCGGSKKGLVDGRGWKGGEGRVEERIKRDGKGWWMDERIIGMEVMRIVSRCQQNSRQLSAARTVCTFECAATTVESPSARSPPPSPPCTTHPNIFRLDPGERDIVKHSIA